MRPLMIVASVFVVAVPTLAAQAKAPKPAPLHWGPAPPVFPKGARMAVVSGDPSKVGQFTIELAMPSGYKIRPHFHPTDEAVEVKKGTLLVGMGDAFDAAKAKPMKVGEKGSIAANMHHYAQAKGSTVVAIQAMGPFAMTYVNPADDPQRKAAPKPKAKAK